MGFDLNTEAYVSRLKTRLLTTYIPDLLSSFCN